MEVKVLYTFVTAITMNCCFILRYQTYRTSFVLGWKFEDVVKHFILRCEDNVRCVFDVLRCEVEIADSFWYMSDE